MSVVKLIEERERPWTAKEAKILANAIAHRCDVDNEISHPRFCAMEMTCHFDGTSYNLKTSSKCHAKDTPDECFGRILAFSRGCRRLAELMLQEHSFEYISALWVLGEEEDAKKNASGRLKHTVPRIFWLAVSRSGLL